MTLAELRHIATARAIRRATVVQRDDGQYQLVLDIGPESVVLAAARRTDQPRGFRSIDGVIGTLRDLKLSAFSTELAPG